MPSTYTSGLRLIDQADGENANTWGQLADINFNLIDDAITAVTDVDMTGSSSITLTVSNGLEDQSRSAVLKLIGTPTSANSLIIPDSEKVYGIHATHTSVSGGLTVRTGSGSGVTFYTSDAGFIYCDGTSVFSLNQDSLDPNNNLSDLTNVCAARTNLEMGAFVSISSYDTSTLEVTGGILGVKTSALFNIFWPIGSLYSNRTDGTNPGTLMGFGTWTSAGVGRVPVGVGTGVDDNGVSVTISAQSCGGEYVHTQTTAELIKHRHTLPMSTSDGGTVSHGDAGDGSTFGNANSSYVGSSIPFNVQQPWYSVYMWVRTA